MFMLSGTIMARGGISKNSLTSLLISCGQCDRRRAPVPSSSPALFYGLSPAPPLPQWRLGAMTYPGHGQPGAIPKSFHRCGHGGQRAWAASSPPQHPLCGTAPRRAPPWAICSLPASCRALLGGLRVPARSPHSARRRAGAHQGGDGELRGTGIPPAVPGQLSRLLTPCHHPGDIYGGIATPTEAAVISVYCPSRSSACSFIRPSKVSGDPRCFYGVL